MEHVDEHLERMIGRSLDGELPEEEQLELDRELIRDPAAHAMMRTTAKSTSARDRR